MAQEDGRNLIHSTFPFTEEEHAAAWILLGSAADEARASSSQLRLELADEPESGEDEAGWFSFGPRVMMTGQFRPAIHLAADIHAGGRILSAEARDAWLEEWTTRLPHAEAERRLKQLDLLGSTWSDKREVFRRLLTTGEL